MLAPLQMNSGSVDTVPEPSGCTPLSLSSCDHRQAALSAAGCECSLPEKAMKTCRKFWCPNPPNRGTKPQEGRRHGVCRVERVCHAMQKRGSIVHPLRNLANCSKLRMANVRWAEFKPRLRGSLEPSPNQQRTKSTYTFPTAYPFYRNAVAAQISRRGFWHRGT